MISAKQLRAARVFLSWEQRDLAERCGLSLPTIQRMETLGLERSQAGNVQRVQHAMEQAGIEFVADAGRTGVWLREAALGEDGQVNRLADPVASPKNN